MSKLTISNRIPRFILLAITMGLLGILAGVGLGWPSRAKSYFKSVQTEPKITTKTSALRVLDKTRTKLGDNSILAVRLQNTSGKEIKAYTIASGNVWVTKQYFFLEASIAPNAIDTQFIPLSSNTPQDSRITFESNKELTIAAVFFSNATGEGDPIFVTKLVDEYAGIQAQANRILPCLQGLSSLLTSQRESAVTACEAEALKLPTSSNGKSGDYEAGLVNARTEILNRLKDIKEKVLANGLSEAIDKESKTTRIFQALAQPHR